MSAQSLVLIILTLPAVVRDTDEARDEVGNRSQIADHPILPEEAAVKRLPGDFERAHSAGAVVGVCFVNQPFGLFRGGCTGVLERLLDRRPSRRIDPPQQFKPRVRIVLRKPTQNSDDTGSSPLGGVADIIIVFPPK